MNLFIRLMALNRVKLGRAVTFMKYLASGVSLLCLPKTLIWNKITDRLSNSLKLAELVANELTKSISKKANTKFLFLSDLLLLIVNLSGAYN